MTFNNPTKKRTNQIFYPVNEAIKEDVTIYRGTTRKAFESRQGPYYAIVEEDNGARVTHFHRSLSTAVQEGIDAHRAAKSPAILLALDSAKYKGRAYSIKGQDTKERTIEVQGGISPEDIKIIDTGEKLEAELKKSRLTKEERRTIWDEFARFYLK